MRQAAVDNFPVQLTKHGIETFFQHAAFNKERMAGKCILDIGCGRSKLPGAVGLDAKSLPNVDVVADLDECLPFEDASTRALMLSIPTKCSNTSPNMIGLIEETHRLLRPSGIMVAHVPYFRSSWTAIDPTHIRQFCLPSLNYFVRGTLEYENYRFSDTCFSKIECYLDVDEPPGPLRLLFSTLARRWPYYFENSLLSFLYPFQSLTFVLTK